jgi:hypothetical protein
MPPLSSSAGYPGDEVSVESAGAVMEGLSKTIEDWGMTLLPVFTLADLRIYLPPAGGETIRRRLRRFY